ncbi:hypothetical protein EQP59_09605 [Ornithobacterium rhinotracheale]|uniref:Uncharacterized protein n=1 Tax=Ornithobacterium rhinotracheale TaxID=28251 RepID=A0A3R5USU3_ORNRH|nr:hypothetical protein [Ornithobacterium rhinotracheale]QAR30591.1 hypothetical protein EQP59_04115 [Ornithobacterium rhinotracheale]QAR31575.1 hypothetical protein EQP59_09605 [Ornithobacterium rhinotracheale]
MKFLSDLTNVLKLLGVALVALIIWMAFKGFQKTVLLGKDGIPDKISEAFRQKTSKEQFRIYLDYWAVRAKWFFFGSYPSLSDEQVKHLRNENKNLGSFVGRFFQEQQKLLEKYDLKKEQRYQH